MTWSQNYKKSVLLSSHPPWQYHTMRARVYRPTAVTEIPHARWVPFTYKGQKYILNQRLFPQFEFDVAWITLRNRGYTYIHTQSKLYILTN